MSFVIYPAIDILEGNCVQLVQGDYNQGTIYDDNPVKVAQEWQRQGGEWIHIVDLDGAKVGEPVNANLIGEIAKSVQIPVQVGGGLRTLASVERLLELGVARVILGTAAIEDRDFVLRVLDQYADQVAIGLDLRDGYLATRGWVETTEVKAEDLAVELVQAGAKTFIVTDIAHDGMMQGPNVESIQRIAEVSGQSVIASGGVSKYEDIKNLAALKEQGISGAIIGKAMYTGAIEMEEALRLTK